VKVINATAVNTSTAKAANTIRDLVKSLTSRNLRFR
jgi:hypothetical protein